MDFLGKSILTYPERDQKLLTEDFTGVNWGKISFAHKKNSLMVVHDFDIVSVIVAPCKTDAPLVIDANTVLTGAIIL